MRCTSCSSGSCLSMFKACRIVEVRKAAKSHTVFERYRYVVCMHIIIAIRHAGKHLHRLGLEQHGYLPRSMTKPLFTFYRVVPSSTSESASLPPKGLKLAEHSKTGVHKHTHCAHLGTYGLWPTMLECIEFLTKYSALRCKKFDQQALKELTEQVLQCPILCFYLPYVLNHSLIQHIICQEFSIVAFLIQKYGYGI